VVLGELDEALVLEPFNGVLVVLGAFVVEPGIGVEVEGPDAGVEDVAGTVPLTVTGVLVPMQPVLDPSATEKGPDEPVAPTLSRMPSS